MQQVSDYELVLMKIIWGRGGAALYAEIVEDLEGRGERWTKNTIITLLLRLIDKGLLRTSKIGRRNRYSALISEREYRDAQTKRFLDKIYEGDAKDLVSTLIQGEYLTPEAYETLRAFWEERKRSDG